MGIRWIQNSIKYSFSSNSHKLIIDYSIYQKPIQVWAHSSFTSYYIIEMPKLNYGFCTFNSFSFAFVLSELINPIEMNKWFHSGESFTMSNQQQHNVVFDVSIFLRKIHCKTQCCKRKESGYQIPIHTIQCCNINSDSNSTSKMHNK